jgi:TonB family protein
MATTEIPPRKPFLPPPLYSAAAEGAVDRSSQVAGENLPVPMFLTSLQDEMERSHRREAFWMSVLVHLVALVAFVNGAKLLPAHASVLVPTKTEVLQTHEYTFLVLPPDLQRHVPSPHTDVLSDKNRMATAQEPAIDRRVLQHILASSAKGSGSPKLHLPQSRHLEAQISAAPTPSAAAEAASATPPMPIRAGQAEMVSVPAPVPATAPAAAQPTPAVLVGTPLGNTGSKGGGTAANGLKAAQSQVASRSNVDVLSDTMGVDFGPYLSQVLHDVRVNWYNRIPESARAPLMKRGKVSIQFDILRTGQIAAMQVVGTSGDPSLDGAAIAGINISGPFPPLPPRFQGQYLALRFHFFYNPDSKDLR